MSIDNKNQNDMAELIEKELFDMYDESIERNPPKSFISDFDWEHEEFGFPITEDNEIYNELLDEYEQVCCNMEYESISSYLDEDFEDIVHHFTNYK